MNDIATRALASLHRPDLLISESLIGARWYRSECTLPVHDPATSTHIGSVYALPPAMADEAIDAASAALPGWSDRTPVERGGILRAWASLIRKNGQDLAIIMTAEQGKPLAEAEGEIAYGASFLDWFAAEGERAYGETPPSHIPGSQLSMQWQPIGVVVAITPWNFPSAMITRKAGAALAAGCTVVVKPAPETPFSANALARLAVEAGMPPGVLQVIHGEAIELTSRLLAHPEARAVSFTGSLEVGRQILSRSVHDIKRVSLELGGNAPFLVFADVDVNEAVAGCMAAKFATSGQDCLAANRIYVQRSIHDEFVEKFTARTKALRVGHGLDRTTDIGPMTRQSVTDKCFAQIHDAVDAGATLMAGSKDAHDGLFVPPAVLSGVSDSMPIAQEETFGPVAGILSFDEEEEVLTRANRCELGLAAYVYTNDLRRGLRATRALQYGMVAVNTPRFTGAPIPFGGWKRSGLGREGSSLGLNEFMEAKYVCFGNVAR